MPRRSLLDIARQSGNPVIGNDSVTFVWYGKKAPLLLDDSHNWEENPQIMHHTDASVWIYRLSLEPDAYLEYAFLDPVTHERINDPLNPNRIWNGINAYNQFFYMPKALPSQLGRKLEEDQSGAITRYQVPTLEFVTGKFRTVYLYQPPVGHPVPLLVVYDGVDYLRRGKLNRIVDNLVAMKRIQPIALALVQNGGRSRSVEYLCSESLLGFLGECIFPLAIKELNILPLENRSHGVLGASMGGLMSVFTAMRLPQVFSKVICQSGVFITPEYQYSVVDLVRYAPPVDIDIWMDAGKYEWLLENNRQMQAILTSRHYRVQYREFSGGHNYTSWCGDLSHGLEWLFPGPKAQP
jgi:enterochelin esterase-like enzyme